MNHHNYTCTKDDIRTIKNVHFGSSEHCLPKVLIYVGYTLGTIIHYNSSFKVTFHHMRWIIRDTSSSSLGPVFCNFSNVVIPALTRVVLRLNPILSSCLEIYLEFSHNLHKKMITQGGLLLTLPHLACMHLCRIAAPSKLWKFSPIICTSMRPA